VATVPRQADNVATSRLLRLRRLLGRWRRLLQALSVAELREVARVIREPAARRRARLERLTLGGDGRLIFVCHGNIMRSAFATAVVRAAGGALAGRTLGAGTHARAGRAAQDDALAAAPAFGVSLADHQATPIADLALREEDVLVGMDLANVGRLRTLPGVDPARVFLIGDALEPAPTSLAERVVEDPYGHGPTVTHRAFARVREGAVAFSRRLAVVTERAGGETPPKGRA
jgi:protein-tyrosine-phosphatase